MAVYQIILTFLVLSLTQDLVDGRSSRLRFEQEVPYRHYHQNTLANRQNTNTADLIIREIPQTGICHHLLVQCLRTPGSSHRSSHDHRVKKCLKRILRVAECKHEAEMNSQFNRIREKHHQKDNHDFRRHHHHHHRTGRKHGKTYSEDMRRLTWHSQDGSWAVAKRPNTEAVELKHIHE